MTNVSTPTPETEHPVRRANEPSRIVLGVDDSEAGQGAIAWARWEAQSLGLPVRLVCATDEFVVPLPYRMAGALTDTSTEILDRTGKQVADGGITIERRAASGRPDLVLLDEAAGAQSVVLGRRGRGGFARLMLGSTSIAVAGRMPVPVVVVPGDWTEPAKGPVIVGIDPGRPSAETFQFAYDHARRLDRPLVVLAVWDLGYAFGLAPFDAGQNIPVIIADTKRDVSRLVAHWRGTDTAVDVQVDARIGHAARGIVEAEMNAALVVLGRPRRHSLGGFPLGSTARAVLHHVMAPTAIVPEVYTAPTGG